MPSADTAGVTHRHVASLRALLCRLQSAKLVLMLMNDAGTKLCIGQLLFPDLWERLGRQRLGLATSGHSLSSMRFIQMITVQILASEVTECPQNANEPGASALACHTCLPCNSTTLDTLPCNRTAATLPALSSAVCQEMCISFGSVSSVPLLANRT